MYTRSTRELEWSILRSCSLRSSSSSSLRSSNSSSSDSGSSSNYNSGSLEDDRPANYLH